MRSFALPLLLVASTAQAQLGPIPGEERFAALADAQEGTSGSVGAGLMFGQLEEDYFVLVSPRFDLNVGPVGLGLQVPLNLRVIDNDPPNDDDIGGLLREEDWDEPSDFLKIIRYVRYGYKHTGLMYARVGEIAADLGHGTIMGRYLNNVDINTFRLGSQFDVYTEYGGVETVVSDYGSVFGGSPESRLIGIRAYVKPYAFFGDPESVFNMFAIGFTMASDLNAPRALSGDLDNDGNFVVAREASQTVYGFDLEAKVLDTELVQITPYTDTNFISNAGWGWHLGTAFHFRLPFIIDLALPARLEYRRFSSDYIPTYFSSFYEIERYSFVPAGDAALPKAAYVKSLGGGDGINGIYGDAAFSFAGVLQIGALYEDYSDGAGVGGNFAAFLSVPALEVVQFKAFYTRTDVDDLGDLFALDEDSLLVAEGRVALFAYTYLVGRFTRRWVPNPGAPPAFTSEDDWRVGLELSFDF